MATYKKRGSKKSLSSDQKNSATTESTTAEVFETLDSGASKTEEWVARYQNHILIVIGVAVVGILSYLGYDKFVQEPKTNEAISELNQAQYYFDLAVNSEDSDSLYVRALNGGEGKYGFLDIIENYSGTSAANLATYNAGMSYLNLKDYQNAITYLDAFDSDDILLSALSKGAIGDAFAQIGQNKEAFDYYKKAANSSDNIFSTPKYLYKAAMLGVDLGELKQSLSMLKCIEEEFIDSEEYALVGVQIGRLETLLQ